MDDSLHMNMKLEKFGVFDVNSKVKHVGLTQGFQICEGFPMLSPSTDMVATNPWPTHTQLAL